MPARKQQTGISFKRHIAPLAPVALALAMQTAQHAGHPHGVGSFQPVCTLPFDGERNDIFDNECGIDGGSSDPGKQAESRAKNNLCAATQPIRQIAYQELLDLQNRSASVPKSLTDRSVLKQMGEGQYVSYIAFIKDAHYSDVAAGEAVNCNIPGNATNDIHIVLMNDPNDKDECDSTTAEMSPHYRPADWTPENLNSIKGRPVRIRGQLFYDGSHTPCSGASRPNPKRKSLWEIHPVYSLEVCSDDTIEKCETPSAEWTSLSQLHTSEQK